MLGDITPPVKLYEFLKSQGEQMQNLNQNLGLLTRSGESVGWVPSSVPRHCLCLHAGGEPPG